MHSDASRFFFTNTSKSYIMKRMVRAEILLKCLAKDECFYLGGERYRVIDQYTTCYSMQVSVCEHIATSTRFILPADIHVAMYCYCDASI